jgi:hypothetical protein
MDVTFRCPCCDRTVTVALAANTSGLRCPQCGAETEVAPDALAEGGVRRCLVCPSNDLFLRKDFPQRLGVALVLAGFAAFLVANYFYRPLLAFGFLFATAAIDVVLYLLVAEALVCYRCGAHYRGATDLAPHAGFQLETHERYRQLAARLAARPSRPPTSTAGQQPSGPP